jgi:uncharacterized RDD family membrane protein YckC
MVIEPSQSTPDFGTLPTGSYGRRLLARSIDHLILILVAAWIVSGFSLRFSPSSVTSSILGLALTIGYFTVLEARTGRTLGKLVIGLKTVGPEGHPPSLEQAIKRNAWYALAIVPGIGDLAQLLAAITIGVTIWNSDLNVGWHDTFAGGTRVIDTRNTTPSISRAPG